MKNSPVPVYLKQDLLRVQMGRQWGLPRVLMENLRDLRWDLMECQWVLQWVQTGS